MFAAIRPRMLLNLRRRAGSDGVVLFRTATGCHDQIEILYQTK